MSQDAERDTDAENAEPYYQRPPGQGSKRPQVAVEQHLWRHSLESGALALVGTLFAGMVLPHAWPLWIIAAAGAALTGVIWYTSLTATGSLVMANYLLAWGVLITGWLVAAHLLGWRHAPMLAALIICGLILTPLGAVAIGHHREQIRRDAEDRAKLADTAPLRRWERILARAGIPDATVLDVYPHDGGLEITGRLAKSTDERRAVTFDQLKTVATEIAVTKRVPEDCVYFERQRSGSAADFTLHIRKPAADRPDIVLPAENHPRSINNRFAIGVLDNGRRFELTYREIAVMIVGTRGSGKTNLENVFIAQLARCIDAVIFMIDMKGGRSARPWVMPWVQGWTPRPVIDWLATDRTEALLMLDALIAAGKARARTGEGWDKITPSVTTPAIILVVDETGVATGHNLKEDGIPAHVLATKLAQVTETFRSECIDPLIAALRANVDIMGSTAVKSQSTVRFGMRTEASSDGDSVFPDDHHAAKMVARLNRPGDCLVKTGPDISPPVHCYRIGGPEQITNIATWAGTIRPEPEARIQEAMGEAYSMRWKREHGARLLAEWRASAGVPEPRARDDGDDKFDDIVSHLEDPEQPKDPRIIEVYRMLISAGVMGMTVGRITTRLGNSGMTTPRETVHRWLADAEGKGYVRRTGRPHNRWVWHAGEDPEDIPGMDPAM